MKSISQKVWKTITVRIPKEYRDEFIKFQTKQNYTRISGASIVLFLIELILYIMPDRLFAFSRAIEPFLLSNLLLIPAVWIVYKNYSKVNILLSKIVQSLFAMSILMLGVFLVLEAQKETDLVHMYLMTVVDAVYFISMMTINRTVVLGLAYLIFILYLPVYQPDPDAIFVIGVNTFVFNLFAWLLGSLLLHNQFDSFRHQKELLAKNEKLQDLARRDSMTNLYNHRTLFKKLDQEIKRSRRIKYPLSILIADIDDFKQINDSRGHQFGDKIIKLVAEIFTAHVRGTDTVGRYGGEEFMIIMPDTDLSAAEILAARITRALEKEMHIQDIQLTISAGISQYSGESLNEFIKLTDTKLYQAKSNGKNQVVSA